MSNLSNQQIKQSFNGLLQVPGGITSTLKTVQDGNGNPTGLQISSTGANVTTSSTFVASDNGTQYTGAVPRLIADGFGDVFNVKDFGATGNGITNDTAAIQAAIAAAALKTVKAVYFPSGTYKISAPLTISGIRWSIYGDGPGTSIIKTSANDDIFRIDLTTGFSGLSLIENLGFDRDFIMPYSNSCGIRVVTIPDVSNGAYAWRFKCLNFQHLYRGIRFGATAQSLWNGIPSLEKHSFCEFVEIKTLASTAYEPFEAISFDRGCGPHHTIIGGSLFASGTGSSCIKVGNGQPDSGFGDLLISGVHLVNAENAVSLIGPTNPLAYNENVTISGCQFDGPLYRTIYARNMSNCRFVANNSTVGADITLFNCTNIMNQTADNARSAFPGRLIGGASIDVDNGVTAASTAQFHTRPSVNYNLSQFAWSDDVVGSIRMITKSRGTTVGTHAAVQSGDYIGEDRYLGSNGVQFVPGASVSLRVVGTPTNSDSYIPMMYRIATSPDASTPPIPRIIADEAGNVAIGGNEASTPTTGTNGFVYLQKSLGAPTGVPEKSYGGKIPVIIDETNSKLWARIGGTWKYVQFI